MSLSKEDLKNDFLEKIMNGKLDTIEKTAETWTEVYCDYLINGITSYGVPIVEISSIAKTSLKNNLISSFGTISPGIITFESNINDCFSSFLTGLGLTGLGNIIFAVTTSTIVGVDGFINFSNITQDNKKEATDDITSMLDIYTRTVRVSDSSSGATGYLV